MTAKTRQEVYRHLREFRDALDRPPGYAEPEISAGTILMMMSPSPRHDRIALEIQRQLLPQLTDDLVAATIGDVEDEVRGALRRPDVLVLPETAYDAPTGIDPREVLLAVEVVSPGNPDNDYSGKLRDYPAMGIPHYLIVDPRDGTCQHHFKPALGAGQESGRAAAYTAHVPYVFGDAIRIGDWSVDTGRFARYPKDED